jgi:hypothetical protein
MNLRPYPQVVYGISANIRKIMQEAKCIGRNKTAESMQRKETCTPAEGRRKGCMHSCGSFRAHRNWILAKAMGKPGKRTS